MPSVSSVSEFAVRFDSAKRKWLVRVRRKKGRGGESVPSKTKQSTSLLLKTPSTVLCRRGRVYHFVHLASSLFARVIWVEAPKGKDEGKEAKAEERAEVAEDVGATAATETVVGSSCWTAKFKSPESERNVLRIPLNGLCGWADDEDL